MTTNGRRYYRVDEVARDWNVSRRTVERLVHRGELKIVKIGRMTRIKAEDVGLFEKKSRPDATGGDS